MIIDIHRMALTRNRGETFHSQLHLEIWKTGLPEYRYIELLGEGMVNENRNQTNIIHSMSISKADSMKQ